VHEDPTFGEPTREFRRIIDAQTQDNYQSSREVDDFAVAAGDNLMEGMDNNADATSMDARNRSESGEAPDTDSTGNILSDLLSTETDSNGNIVYKYNIISAAKLEKFQKMQREIADEQELLVEALRPATSQKCCIPKVYQERNNPKDVDCFGTCYNERACHDPNFPFDSAEEKAEFPMANVTNSMRRGMMRECKSPKPMMPPVEWCQAPTTVGDDDNAEEDGTTQNQAHLVRGIPPAGCVHATNGGGSGAFQHGKMIVFPTLCIRAFCLTDIF